MSKGRVEAFSDGVFAIILTLLVLELRVPDIPAHATLSQYGVAMVPLLPKFFSFVLSFVIISIHWVSHHSFFASLKKTPIGIIWLNNLFLLWLCFMPFPTALLGDHLTDQFPLLLFGANQLLAALTFFAFRLYAVRNNLFIDASSLRAVGPRHSLPAIAVYTVSILLVFVNIYLALASFLLIPLIYMVPNRNESN